MSCKTCRRPYTLLLPFNTLRNFVCIKVLQLTTSCQKDGAKLRYNGSCFLYGEDKCLDTRDDVLIFSECSIGAQGFEFVGELKITYHKNAIFASLVTEYSTIQVLLSFILILKTRVR